MEKNTDKKNIIIYIISFILIISIILNIYLLINKPKCNCKCENTNNNDYNETIEGFDKTAINKLEKYGKEIYKNKGYLNFQKGGNDVYYANYNDLIKLNYDVSFLDKECCGDSPIIYFDINNSLADNYIDEPLQYSFECIKK